MNDWISVKDKLPDESGLYLVTGQASGQAREVWICEFACFDYVRGWCNPARRPIVEAWMPII